METRQSAKIPASVIILTKNSGKTIRRALESVACFDDIVVCDGGSVDNTIDIAKEYGANIFIQSPRCLEGGAIKDFSCARNDCLSHTVRDWVLYIDSDEAASAELVEEIRNIVREARPRFLIYKIPAGIIVDGKLIKYSSNYPGWQTRFFNKRSGARFIKPVHERIHFDKSRVAMGELRGPWHYFMAGDGSDMSADIPKYIGMEIGRYRNKNFFARVKGCLAALATAFKIAVKSLRNYVFHGFKYSMPPRLEYLRIKYQLSLALAIMFKRS